MCMYFFLTCRWLCLTFLLYTSFSNNFWIEYRTSFLAAFVPMTYLILKCMFLFIKQRKKLSKKKSLRFSSDNSTVNGTVSSATIEIVGLEPDAANQTNDSNAPNVSVACYFVVRCCI